MSYKVISTVEIPEEERVTTDRPDYTLETVEIDVTVAQERALAAAIIKSSNDIPALAGYDSDWTLTGDYNKLIGTLFTNQACTIYLEQSIDGETIHSQQTQAYPASSTTPAESTWSYEIGAPYIRVRVIPAIIPTTFSVWLKLSIGA